MAAPEKINEEFVKPYHGELSSKAWSIRQHHSPKHFLLKPLSNY